MPRFEFSVDIARAPADVFAYLTDITKLPEWQSGVVEAAWVSEGRVRQVRDFRGSRSESELRVTADEASRRFAIETLSGPVSLSLDCALQDSGLPMVSVMPFLRSCLAWRHAHPAGRDTVGRSASLVKWRP